PAQRRVGRVEVDPLVATELEDERGVPSPCALEGVDDVHAPLTKKIATEEQRDTLAAETNEIVRHESDCRVYDRDLLVKPVVGSDAAVPFERFLPGVAPEDDLLAIVLQEQMPDELHTRRSWQRTPQEGERCRLEEIRARVDPGSRRDNGADDRFDEILILHHI